MLLLKKERKVKQEQVACQINISHLWPFRAGLISLMNATVKVSTILFVVFINIITNWTGYIMICCKPHCSLTAQSFAVSGIKH